MAGSAGGPRRRNVHGIRAVTYTPVSRPLTDLLAVTYGPLPVLTDLLADAEGVMHAFIYGSWAARYLGEPGPLPDHVDLLVLATPHPADLDQIPPTAHHLPGRPL